MSDIHGKISSICGTIMLVTATAFVVFLAGYSTYTLIKVERERQEFNAAVKKSTQDIREAHDRTMKVLDKCIKDAEALKETK